MLVFIFDVTFYLGRAMQSLFSWRELLLISILAFTDIGVFIPGLKKTTKCLSCLIPLVNNMMNNCFSKFTKDCQPKSIKKWSEKCPTVNNIHNYIREVVHIVFLNVVFTKVTEV